MAIAKAALWAFNSRASPIFISKGKIGELINKIGALNHKEFLYFIDLFQSVEFFVLRVKSYL